MSGTHVRVKNRRDQRKLRSYESIRGADRAGFHIVMKEGESRDRSKVWFIESVRHSIKIRLREELPSQTA